MSDSDVAAGGSGSNITNEQFLQTVFGERWQDAHVCGFAGDPKGESADWRGAKWRDSAPGFLAGLGEHNAYFAISLIAGSNRRKEAFESCFAIVLDDIGVKADAADAVLALGHPSWRLETSRGNEQWGYLLTPCARDPAAVDRMIGALVARDLTDPGAASIVRYMRLPVGRNEKESISPPGWVTVLREWRPDRRFTLATLLERIGVDATMREVTDEEIDARIAAARSAGAGTNCPVIRQLAQWDLLAGTRTNDGGWHLRACPWEHEHTPGPRAADARTAVYEGGAFNCFHGHCAGRGRTEFLAWFEARLSEESGGLFESVAALEMGRVDPPPSGNPPPQPDAPAPAAEPLSPGARFLAEMVWVTGQGAYFSRRTRSLLPKVGVDVGYVHTLGTLLHTAGPGGRLRVISPTEWFTRQPDRVEVDNLTYWPGEETVFVAGGIRYVNRWAASAVGVATAAIAAVENWMVRPWLELVWHVFGNEGARFVVRVLDMMALIVAAPGVKPGWHVLVHGAQGIGKDLLMTPVAWAVGGENVGRVTAAGLHRDHNPWAEKRLVLVNELKQTTLGSASGRDQYTTLKALTENTSDFIAINEKNVKLYHARNVSALYITSNEPDALTLDADDRRFMVCGSTAGKWPAAKYSRLVAWLGGETGGGTETVAAWLRQRWQRMSAGRRAALVGNAPGGASKIAMVEAGDQVRAWTREQIDDGIWRDLLTAQDIDGCYRDAVRAGALRYPVSAHRWGRVLKDLGGNKVYNGAQVRLMDGRHVRIWAVRAPERFYGMSESAIAQAYKSAAQHQFADNDTVTDFPPKKS